MLSSYMAYVPDSLYILFSYFLGSVPFGLIVADLAGIGDLRSQGSGNIGATNVTRVGGKKLGLITLLLDAAKGAVVVLVAQFFFSKETALFSGMAAVIGHIFPIWIKFKGGKGVATTLAVLIATYPPAGIFACGVWLAVFLAFKISSLSAIAAMLFTPVYAFFFADQEFMLGSLILSALVIFRHRENIRRLLNGEERRIK